MDVQELNDCPACSGSGWQDDMEGGGEPCEVCRGAGSVPVTSGQ